jgi:hypothetical protein
MIGRKPVTTALLALVVAMPLVSRAAEPSFEVYGFAQLDAIQDFNRVNPAWNATLRPSRIPTVEGQYGSDGQSILSVRQSRLGAQSTLPVGDGSVFAKVEFDFFGVGADEGQTTLRLRHAYGQYKSVLAGQTNSLFMDGSIFPNTIDYWGPCGMVFLRNPQLRWTPVSGETNFAVAIENPSTDVDTGRLSEYDPNLAEDIRSDSKIPDLTAQYRQEGNWGHVQMAGIFRRLGYETSVSTGPQGHNLGWGVDLTSTIKVKDRNKLLLGVVYGEGIANYMNDGGMDIAPKTGGATVKSEAVPLLGLSAYYDHYWGEKFSSSVGYSRTQVENTDFQTDGAFRYGQYASANLLYYPAKNLFYGAEYLWGTRKDRGGASGSDQRIQLSANFKFSSKDATR